MTKSHLHDFRGQFEAAIGFPVDTPRGVEVPQSVQTSVLRLQYRLASLVPDELTVRVFDIDRDACRELQRNPRPINYVGVPLDFAVGVREDQARITLWAGEFPFSQGTH